MRQTASSSPSTTINSWGVVRARNMAAFMLHGVIFGMCFSILKGDWNFILGTEFGYSQMESFGMGVAFSIFVLLARFIWGRTPASSGGGLKGH